MARSPASAESLVEKIRPFIADERVLAAVAAVPRHLFVPAALSRFAWENTALPIGAGQTISQPVVVARMCEVLELAGDEKVLDVGTGSGYHAAVLSHLAREVWSIERKAKLAEQARRNLAAAGIENVHLIVGDGSGGYPSEGPYGAINVAAAAHDVPTRARSSSSAAGGRLVAPVNGGAQRLLLERRRGDTFERTSLEPVRFVPLVGDAELSPGAPSACASSSLPFERLDLAPEAHRCRRRDRPSRARSSMSAARSRSICARCARSSASAASRRARAACSSAPGLLLLRARRVQARFAAVAVGLASALLGAADAGAAWTRAPR